MEDGKQGCACCTCHSCVPCAASGKPPLGVHSSPATPTGLRTTPASCRLEPPERLAGHGALPSHRAGEGGGCGGNHPCPPLGEGSSLCSACAAGLPRTRCWSPLVRCRQAVETQASASRWRPGLDLPSPVHPLFAFPRSPFTAWSARTRTSKTCLRSAAASTVSNHLSVGLLSKEAGHATRHVPP